MTYSEVLLVSTPDTAVNSSASWIHQHVKGNYAWDIPSRAVDIRGVSLGYLPSPHLLRVTPRVRTPTAKKNRANETRRPLCGRMVLGPVHAPRVVPVEISNALGCTRVCLVDGTDA